MNKKVVAVIILVVLILGVLILGVGIGSYFLLSGNEKSNQLSKNKIPEEEIKVGNGDTKTDKDGKKSLVVYFSVPETDDPNKKMTTE